MVGEYFKISIAKVLRIGEAETPTTSKTIGSEDLAAKDATLRIACSLSADKCPKFNKIAALCLVKSRTSLESSAITGLDPRAKIALATISQEISLVIQWIK